MYWRDAETTLLKPIKTAPRLGLFTDMDGTISPIVNEPDKAQITTRSREYLQSLNAHLALVAVVSGRVADDIYQRVGLPDLTYIGNHGLERRENGVIIPAPEVAQYRPALKSAYDALKSQLLPDMTIEDKTATLSVHYRQTMNPESVADQFRPLIKTIADRYGLRVFEGRMIFELRPPIDVNKGTAFQSLISEYELDAAIYIGDDTTDVDALNMARKLRDESRCYCLGIGVESADSPTAVRDAADVVASGVPDVEEFLSWLLKARSASST